MSIHTQTHGRRKHKNGASHIGGVIDGAEALVNATADMSESGIDDIRKSLEGDLEAARAYVEKLEVGLVNRASGANEFVHEKPWQSIGVAVGAGVAVGVILGAVAFRH
ncbi:MAG: DUF883 family protein [Polyangiaceae bacterium]|nr:DUF883 family protein [Polyangiaceae bacterium]